MNLAIDVGNSYVKLAVFNKYNMVNKRVVKSNCLITTVKSIIKTFPDINHAIAVSVSKINAAQQEFIKSQFLLKIIDYNLNFPFENFYKTPQTLGKDRLVLAAAAAIKFPKTNCLIIDAGTCITYDFINNNAHYLGGAISPGLAMRYQAMHNQTSSLPLLPPSFPKHIIGQTTEQAIHSGIVNGIQLEIDGVINNYISNYEHLTVILTGGDTNFLSKRLKSTIFANPNFLLEGLNLLLYYNLIK